MWYKTWKLFLLQIQIPKSIDRNSNFFFYPVEGIPKLKTKQKNNQKNPQTKTNKNPQTKTKSNKKNPNTLVLRHSLLFNYQCLNQKLQKHHILPWMHYNY